MQYISILCDALETTEKVNICQLTFFVTKQDNYIDQNAYFIKTKMCGTGLDINHVATGQARFSDCQSRLQFSPLTSMQIELNDIFIK